MGDYFRRRQGHAVSRRRRRALRHRRCGRQLPRAAAGLAVRLQHVPGIVDAHAPAGTRSDRRCRRLAACTEEPGQITRTFLSPPMHEVHRLVRGWMEEAGHDACGSMRWATSAAHAAQRTAPDDRLAPRHGAGRRRVRRHPRRGAGHRAGRTPPRRLALGSRSSDSPKRKACASACRSSAAARWWATPVHVDERGARSTRSAPSASIPATRRGRVGDDVRGYLEFHIEQGPCSTSQDLPLGVVDAIAGQSRVEVTLRREANHAGTTPMALRRDALAARRSGSALVERTRAAEPGLVATVGRLRRRARRGQRDPGRGARQPRCSARR